MSDKRQAKLNALIEKRDALRAKDFDKVDKINGTKPVKVPSMNGVYVDIALAIFCLVTIVGAPLSLFFVATAIFKYSLVKKAEANASQREEPRA